MNENEKPVIGTSEVWGPQGMIEIFWEWKEEDHVCVSVELSDSTKRLPYEIRRELVARLRGELIPSKRKAVEQV